VCGHASPPKVASTFVRVRDFEPPPHDLVQADQAPNAVVSQWIGHGPSLQVSVSSVCGQASPPNDAATVSRVRIFAPPPQDRLHDEKLAQL
jgi:hypothetical protein